VDAALTRGQEILAAIWSHVLGVDRVRPEDDFFLLGGNSMRCLEVVARAERAGLQISPRQLYEHPTIAGLARAIDAAGKAHLDAQ
jgi:aryl carrier-like protein